jgi:hypothetical protein
LDTTKVFFILKFFSNFSDGWGLKGYGGTLHHNALIIRNAANGFRNKDVIGVLLNMDDFTLEFFIQGKSVLQFSNPAWKVNFIVWKKLKSFQGMTIYPSASTLCHRDVITINFDVKCPDLSKK